MTDRLARLDRWWRLCLRWLRVPRLGAWMLRAWRPRAWRVRAGWLRAGWLRAWRRGLRRLLPAQGLAGAGNASGQRRRRLVGPLFVVLCAGIYLFLLPTGWVFASTADYRADPGRVPAMPVVLVLGAGLFGEQPSPFLARRLDIAAGLYRRGTIRALLVSGDNSRDDYNETDAMRAYLVGKGVPAYKVVGDYAGFDTWDSCSRAKRIFGVGRAIVVTQRFHLPRAVALCRAAGIDTWGAGDDSLSAAPGPTLWSYAREPLAMIKAAGDAVRKPDPHFLGRHETGVERALAR
jgi:vancomycin permeability regulator SanA